MHIILIPLVSAFIGWLIIKILVQIFLSPARTKSIVQQLGSSLASHLISPDSITAQLKDPEMLKQVSPAIEAHLNTFLEVKLQEKLPVVATFIGPSTLAKIKEAMIEEIDLLLPEVMVQYAESLVRNMDVEQIIAKKLDNPVNHLHIALASALRPQIKMLAISGAFIGFISSLLTILLLEFSL